MLTVKKKIKRVAFFGDADAKKTDRHFKDAKETAKLLAQKGYVIVNGGGPGIMLAATLGAKEARGRVEIVLVDKRKMPPGFEGSSEQNFLLADEKIISSDYLSRLCKLVELADAFVIFRGGTGTLAEVGVVWSLAKFAYGNHRPLIFFGKVWGKIIKALTVGLNLEEKERRVVTVVKTKEGVYKKLKEKE